jgi:hypothetical protein
LSNDHYMHLAWAQQLLFGELPGRDFGRSRHAAAVCAVRDRSARVAGAVQRRKY